MTKNYKQNGKHNFGDLRCSGATKMYDRRIEKTTWKNALGIKQQKTAHTKNSKN